MGDRCLAAIALGLDYIGIDSNINLTLSYNQMCSFFPIESKIQILFDQCEKVNIDNFDFDLVLSSPPFWEKGKIVEKICSHRI